MDNGEMRFKIEATQEFKKNLSVLRDLRIMSTRKMMWLVDKWKMVQKKILKPVIKCH